MLTKEKIKQVLDRDINILVNGLLEALPQKPEAIFLCGGYGRGEGAWLEDENCNPMPYNDFDLAVITDAPLDKRSTDQLRKQLASRVQINWVDIDYYSKSRLNRLRTTIHNVDLLYASTCIYGNKDAFKEYHLEPMKIGFSDVVTLYKTRMWTFLGSWKGLFRNLNKEEALFFRNQMAKATLAVCDFLLIKNNEYTTSYQQRVDKICHLYSNNETLCKRVRWAISEKLRPTVSELDDVSMQVIYNEVKRLFIWAASEAFGENWKYYFTPALTKRFEMKNPRMWLMSLYAKFRHIKYSPIKSIDIFCAQNYCFLAEKDGQFKPEYIKASSDILLKWNYIQEPVADWNILRELVANARNNV